MNKSFGATNTIAKRIFLPEHMPHENLWTAAWNLRRLSWLLVSLVLLWFYISTEVKNDLQSS